jgi:hypothetical protein
MKKIFIVIASVAMLAAISLNAKPASAKTKCVVTSAPDLPGGKGQDKTCTDDKDGTEIIWTRGNSHDKWVKFDPVEFARRATEENKKATEASYSNCTAGLENFQTLGVWIGPPSAEDCLNFAKDVEAKGRAMIDKGIKELMEPP